MEGFNHQYDPEGEDVVILAGDIHTRGRHEELLMQIPINIPVLMVMGNHESYRGVYEDALNSLRSLEERYPNFKLLDKQSTTINGVEFFGGMMCTDFRLQGDSNQDLAEAMASRGINDFYASEKRLGDGTRLWTTQDHKDEFKQFCESLSFWLRETEGKKRVVVSHFVPHETCIHPRWRDASNLLNPYFTANMDRYLGWEGLWLFGHTHDSADVMVGDTRLVCNPKGYGTENAHYDPNLILEI